MPTWQDPHGFTRFHKDALVYLMTREQNPMSADEAVVEIEGLVPEKVTIALKEDLTISEDLDHEVDHCAALFGYYSVLAQKAQERLKRAETRFEIWLTHQQLEVMKTKDNSKFSKWEVDAEVKQLPKWWAFKEKINKFDCDAGVLKSISNAFEKKIGLVQTKNANRRKELS